MTSIVEIESETLNLVFKLMESDVGILKLAMAKNWENGKEHYKKRLDATFKGLKKVEVMIDNVTNSYNSDIEEYKKTGVTTMDDGPDDDENTLVEIRRKITRVKSDLTNKLNNLKGVHWERDMRVAGYQDFEKDVDDTDTAMKRTDDGKLYYHNLDENTVRVYDD
jgi:hypothetical protein